MGPHHAPRLQVPLARRRPLTVERRVDQDIGFGVRQLVDMEMKAVAPSVNDPYTAVQAVQHLSIIMNELAAVATDNIRSLRGGDSSVRSCAQFRTIPGHDL